MGCGKPCGGIKDGVASKVYVCNADDIVVGSVTVNPNAVRDTEFIILCDDNGTFLRRFIYNGDGTPASITDLTLGGSAYTPSGTVRECSPGETYSVQILKLCDDVNSDGSTIDSFYRWIIFRDRDYSIVSVIDYEPNQVTTYNVQGKIVACPENRGHYELICLCDDVNHDGSYVVPFKRLVLVPTDGTAPVEIGNYTDDLNTFYGPQGTVKLCTEIGNEPVHLTGRSVITGPTTWSPPATTTAITITALTGTPTLTLDSGTSVMYNGEVVKFGNCDCCTVIGTVEIDVAVGEVAVVFFEYLG